MAFSLAQAASQQRVAFTRQVTPDAPKALRATVLRTPVSRGARLAVNAAARESSYPLPSSLLYPVSGVLPPEGRTVQVEDEFCNPQMKFCKTVVHTWEDACDTCGGDGNVRTYISGKKRRTVLSTCLKCSGLGYLRHSSSRVEPDTSHLNNGSGQLTLLRPKEDLEKRKKVEKASKNK
mmetsp:Transcript_8358/g.17259  ORF Transcript_8358/g.17259 Transcript_8358/m.17259 type:complete len:178 (-) Transcript_8358:1759-2292(-)|eukprot:CAMPEP_0118957394 /NCGR_PEP_ID=MMETSP1169-20130426/62080_1 /TAXON_ID=36882 /ORGANISM="Pyramimonas obovata, Strain CCMP722" /LENGTH=177 /DNA_ID=CAMNT_0006905473 /DNA_START=443 /DNA_END=976 /DNA_ORIENTATION=-